MVFGGIRIICPRCLARIRVKRDTKHCPACQFELPVQYILGYENALPLFVQLFGWTRHGKTMFLDVLRLILIKMQDGLWPGFTYNSLTELDLLHERTLLGERAKGQLPGSTQKKDRDSNEVYVMRLDTMPRWRSRSLVIMDHPGEWFEQWQIPVKEMPFLLSVPTTFMILSLPDLEDGQRVNQLLSIYLQNMIQHGIDFKKVRRKLIIVLSKADIIPDLPGNLRNYLMTDDIWPRLERMDTTLPLDGLSLAQYIERMQRVSDEIQHWVETKIPGGPATVTLMQRNNIDASFALISATGHDVDSGSGTQLYPRRVLDPFFWALEFQSQ